MKFTLIKRDSASKARLGKIETEHGTIDTPAFMPVGTRGAVKTLTNQQLYDVGAQIIVGNTYHLMLRPGIDIIDAAGGLHAFMNWKKPILTDSGGFQALSHVALRKITDDGIHFQSYIDGKKYFLGPYECMSIQKSLGSDIVMALDECSPYPCERSMAESGLERTHHWAKICRHCELKEHQSIFGIVQGSFYPDLRQRSAQELSALDFDGYAIGGLSVGEPAEMMNDMISETEPYLPEDKLRYLMGVGTPRNIIEAVMRGVDMFDCVLPTRNARNGTAFTWSGKVQIKSGRYAQDFTPLDSQLDCYTSQFTKAYVRHLINVDEITGLTLVTINNVAFYLDFMGKLRQAIQKGTVDELYARVCVVYPD